MHRESANANAIAGFSVVAGLVIWAQWGFLPGLILMFFWLLIALIVGAADHVTPRKD